MIIQAQFWRQNVSDDFLSNEQFIIKQYCTISRPVGIPKSH